MRRSNRLVFLIGIFLAVVAFVGVFLLLSNGGGGGGGGGTGGATTTEVIAATDIPLGTKILDSMVKTQDVKTADFPANAYKQTSQVVGQVARASITNGQLITSDLFVTSAASIEVPQGLRAIAVQVDQVTGVGTLIKAGDFVDMIVGFTADKFPVVTVTRTAATGETTITPIQGLNATSVKVLLQGMQVLGTLLPPVQTTNGQPAPSNAPALTGQQEIVVIGVPSQYAEVIKFAQMDGNISLVLRSPKDFLDDNGQRISPEPSPDVTTGIILKTLVDKYGVLVPQVVQAILPSPTP